MKLKEHVRVALLLSKELLTRSEFQGSPGEQAVTGYHPVAQQSADPTGALYRQSDDERRYSPRYECEGSAEIRIPSQGRLLRGRIVNLSLGGCYIDTNAALNIGSKVEIVLRVTVWLFVRPGKSNLFTDQLG